jgi:Mrp family chromosome partitioning ATPase
MMNGQLAQPSYVEQFSAGHKAKESGSRRQAEGSYKDSFLSRSSATSDQKPETVSRPKDAVSEDACQESSAPSFEKRDSLIWENNAARFSENDLPALSAKSVKQLESNFRELMLVEANINTLTKTGNAIYVSSCTDQTGKTISAISAAYGLAFYSHKNVLLMDGNPNNCQLHQLFGITRDPGFRDLCAGSVALEDVVLPTRHKNLSLITIGNLDLQPGQENTIRQVLAELSANFDYVICDGGSILSSSVALRNIPAFDAVLIVIECEKTRLEVLQLAEEKIQKCGGPAAVGVVFNRRKYYIPSFVYKVISKK